MGTASSLAARQQEDTVPRKKKAAVAPIKKTYVALVLDSSGSMLGVKDDAIGGFNVNVEQIKTNADLGGETLVTLVTFGEAPDNHPQVKYLNQSPAQLEPLTRQTYQPFGNTPMLDGIGLALSSLEPFDVAGEDVAFLVTVITDGYENASREWTGQRLVDLITRLQTKGNWTITLIGSNVDLNAIRALTGIQQTVSYVSTAQGTQNAMAAQAAASASYFAGRSAGMSVSANLYAGELDLSQGAAVRSLSAKAQADVEKARRLKRK
jgi:uncharacterized protein YegL